MAEQKGGPRRRCLLAPRPRGPDAPGPWRLRPPQPRIARPQLPQATLLVRTPSQGSVAASPSPSPSPPLTPAPTGLGGRLPQPFCVDGNDDDVEEEFSGAMNSGSYFINLMASGYSYPAGYGADQPDDQFDDTPTPDESAVLEDAPACGKEKKRCVDEDRIDQMYKEAKEGTIWR